MVTGTRESFYVHLPSDVNAGGIYNATNHSSHYVVPLRYPIFLTEDYEVGLAELFSPSVTYNINRSYNSDVLVFVKTYRNPRGAELGTGSFTIKTTKVKVPVGQYTPIEFCDTLNRMMKKVEGFKGKIKYHRPSRKIAFHLRSTEAIAISPPRLQQMLGMPDDPSAKSLVGGSFHTDDPDKVTITKPWGPVDFNHNGAFMYVYSSVAQSSYVGNAEAPVLRAVSIANMHYERETMIHREYANVQYFPIRHTTIDKIEVQLCNSFGENMDFQSVGRTLVVLHFRKIKKRGAVEAAT